jgi:DNA helicase-2/ATP-dependent DNA helicase PcrA
MVATTVRPSVYQEAIYTAISTSPDSLVIEAVAGSGKTTTIEQSCKLLSGTETVLFLAFNKSIADELKVRLEGLAEAATFHSVAFRAVTKASVNRLTVDDHKVTNLLQVAGELGYVSQYIQETYDSEIKRLVSLAKSVGYGSIVPADETTISDLIALHGIAVAPDDQPAVIAIVADLIAVGCDKANRTIIDYDDMIYYVSRFNIATPKYDVIFVDEAQDVNPVRLDLIVRLLAPNGRVIAVGDSRQAIYGFTGATVDSIRFIRERFNARALPLSISYRCAQSVVDYAKPYCPQIESSANAPIGSVEHLTEWSTDQFTPTDAILCRNTAPLITLAYRLIGDGIGCRVIGRDIGKGLVNLVKKLSGKRQTTIEQLNIKLSDYEWKQTAKLQQANKIDQVGLLRDRVESLRAAMAPLNPTDSTKVLIDRISELFSDTRTGVVTLSTIHKAKGLEWTNVYILDFDLIPSNYARKDWQVEQENNLAYVAITRAKINLRFISSKKGSD